MRSILWSVLATAIVLGGTTPGVAGVPCQGASQVWTQSSTAFPGQTIGVRVIVRDCYGEPLPGRLCCFHTTRGDSDVFFGNPVLTNSLGLAAASMTTEYSGMTQVWTTCESIDLGPSEVFEWRDPELTIDGSLSGNINSTDFTAHATGTLDVLTGFLDGYVTYDTVPPDYHPCAKLSCVLCIMCCCGDRAMNGAERLFELTDWDYTLDRTLYYPTGDSLWTHGTVWLSGDTLRYDAQWYGMYSSPSDLVDIAPYYQVMRPGGPGRIEITGAGNALRSSGGWIHVRWRGAYTFADTAQLSFAQVSIIDHRCTWDGGVYHVEGSSWVEPLPSCLLDVTCILPGASSHAVVWREGQEYSLASIACVTAGDWLDTHSDRVQVTDGAGNHFRIGENSATYFGVYPCHGEDYAIYLDEGEIYSVAATCVKIRTSCWTHNQYYYADSEYFLRQDTGTTGYFYALGDTLGIWEFLQPGCVDTLLFRVEEGTRATTTGYFGFPDYNVTFDPVTPAESAYIYNTYAADWASVDDTGNEVLAGVELAPGYPNPFAQATEISYLLPVACDVKVTIYSMLGQAVRTLVCEYQTAGHKTVRWDGTNQEGVRVAPGIYFDRLEAAGQIRVRKTVLLD